MDDPTVGVYVHVPFCERVCPYCDFAVVATGRRKLAGEERYVDAFDFVRGAVAVHIASFELRSLRDADKPRWCGELLKDGAPLSVLEALVDKSNAS